LRFNILFSEYFPSNSALQVGEHAWQGRHADVLTEVHCVVTDLVGCPSCFADLGSAFQKLAQC
jgi:hypothetical protein